MTSSCGLAAPLRMTVIAAATMSNALGQRGGLPWKLKGEMAYFRKATLSLTLGCNAQSYINAVIMGRKTWASIPPKFRPLKHRVNIVIGRSQTAAELGISNGDDAWLFSSIEEAVDYLKSRTSSSSSSPAAHATAAAIDRVFVIGGAQLYAECIKGACSNEQRPYLVDRLLITRILHPEYPDCDAFLPEIRDQAQLQHDTQLATHAAKGDEPDANVLHPLDKREWHSSSADELRCYLAFSNQPQDGQDRLGDSLQEESGVLYQFQMWTKEQL